MDATGAGTVIMVAIAAGLWFLYLVPTWFKRREYLATERTATRLQQTLRIMAETAETPEVVRVEATVRDAVRQERVLRAQERADRRRLAEQLRQDEIAERVADRAAADAAARTSTRVAAPVTRVAPDPATLRRRRIRRTRAVSSMVMIAATAVGGVQIVLIVTTGAIATSWLVLGIAGAGACLVVGIQRRLDTVAAPRAARAVEAPVAVAEELAAAPETSRVWTPIPLPRPRYLEHPAPQPVVPRVDPAALLRAAAEEAERARRAAHAEPEVVPFRARPAAVSPFARMGIVDPRDAAAPDLDEVLRRRRTAG